MSFNLMTFLNLLQKSLADKKVQTQEFPGYTAEVPMYEDIGWTSNGSATVNMNNMMGNWCLVRLT